MPDHRHAAAGRHCWRRLHGGLEQRDHDAAAGGTATVLRGGEAGNGSPGLTNPPTLRGRERAVNCFNLWQALAPACSGDSRPRRVTRSPSHLLPAR